MWNANWISSRIADQMTPFLRSTISVTFPLLLLPMQNIIIFVKKNKQRFDHLWLDRIMHQYCSPQNKIGIFQLFIQHWQLWRVNGGEGGGCLSILSAVNEIFVWFVLICFFVCQYYLFCIALLWKLNELRKCRKRSKIESNMLKHEIETCLRMNERSDRLKSKAMSNHDVSMCLHACPEFCGWSKVQSTFYKNLRLKRLLLKMKGLVRHSV